jgi:3-dehydroquinate synthase
VLISEGAASSRLLDEHAVVLADVALRDRLPPTSTPVVVIKVSEEEKDLAGAERVIVDLLRLGISREQRLLAVGGGVVQDLATFVAQIYKRGLAWTYVPTTLMAMADSCIGGKSSINVGTVKNVVGGFHPPARVVIDPRFLSTLSETALAAGLAEAAKISYCRGPECFDQYLERYDSFGAEPVGLLSHVLEAKKWFVEVDEFDHRERRLLNFGHTFGHALEPAVGHRLAHGTAVAVGMLSAAAHHQARPSEALARLTQHCRELLQRSDGVQEALAAFDLETFKATFLNDKKHAAGAFHLILPSEAGSVSEVSVPADEEGWRGVELAVLAAIDAVTGGTS